MSSLRPEQYAALAGSIALQSVCHHHQIKTSQSTLHIYSDNAEVVRRINLTGRPLPGLAKDRDVWDELETTLQALPSTALATHVKAHQDDKCPDISRLERPAYFNVLMDRLAVSTRLQNPSPPTPPKVFPSNKIALQLNGKLITSEEYKAITHALTAPALIEYQLQKFKWTRECFDTIDWECLAAFASYMPVTQRTHITKLLYDWQNTGTQKAYIDPEEANSTHCCPYLCDEPEGPLHYLRCPNKLDMTTVNSKMKVIIKWLQSVNSSPPLTRVLIDAIKQWLQHGTVNAAQWNFPADAHHQILRDAINEQSEIGWDQMLRGRLSRKWRQAQAQWHDEYVDSDDSSQFNSKWWGRKLIAHIVHYTLEQWQERNDVLHQMTEDFDKVCQRYTMTEELKLLYEKGTTSFNPTIRKIFARPMNDVLRRGNDSLARWISSTSEALDWAARSGQQNITSFFPAT
jgi:hypothetical protein